MSERIVSKFLSRKKVMSPRGYSDNKENNKLNNNNNNITSEKLNVVIE